MWRNQQDRPDDPRTTERETQRLARDEYDRPRYGSPPSERVRDSGSPRLDQVRAHEVMTRRVATVHPATPVERAARMMAQADCGALPVTGDNGVLVGMITDRDIALRIVARGRDARHAVVADCMTERVFACHANESIGECMRQMTRHQVRRVPIVDDHGLVVGIVSQGDLARRAAQAAGRGNSAEVGRVVRAVSEPAPGPYR